MQNFMRWSTVFTVLLLVLAACTGGSPAATGASPSAAETTGEDAATICAADEFGCVQVDEGQPITIGTALVITTADADLGQDSQWGAHVAGELVNDEGGVLGHQIAWNDQDDQCSEAGGNTAARALVADPTIVAVIGTSCSSAGVPAAQITSEGGVLMVSPSNTAPSLTAPDTHEPFYARTAHNDEVQGAAMAEFACDELGVKKIATVHDESPYSEQLAGVMAREFEKTCEGGEVTTVQAVASTDTDFRTVLNQIAATEPELIYYPIFTAGGALMTKQARETTGLEETELAGADGMQSDAFLEAAGNAADGLYTSGPDLAFSGDFYEETFIPKYQEISGEDRPVSVFHAHAFDAANLLFEAIKKAAIEEDGTLFIPRTALRDAFFETKDYAGITGTLTCDENGDCADPKISVSLIEGGDYSRIWPE